ncbi:hypothetical protein NMY22_g15940 [Coprinellus aureogranulatus]|nr:hypothetical protein NMY22_g15940 [Coprinellus aureogranulatus]
MTKATKSTTKVRERLRRKMKMIAHARERDSENVAPTRAGPRMEGAQQTGLAHDSIVKENLEKNTALTVHGLNEESSRLGKQLSRSKREVQSLNAKLSELDAHLLALAEENKILRQELRRAVDKGYDTFQTAMMYVEQLRELGVEPREYLGLEAMEGSQQPPWREQLF